MNFSRAWETIVDMLEDLIAALPDLLLALIIFMLFYFIARRTRAVVRSISFPANLLSLYDLLDGF